MKKKEEYKDFIIQIEDYEMMKNQWKKNMKMMIKKIRMAILNQI